MHCNRTTLLKLSMRALLSDYPPPACAWLENLSFPFPVNHTAAAIKVEELLSALELSRSDASEADAARAAQIDADQAAAQLARIGGFVCAESAF